MAPINFGKVPKICFSFPILDSVSQINGVARIFYYLRNHDIEQYIVTGSIPTFYTLGEKDIFLVLGMHPVHLAPQATTLTSRSLLLGT